MNTFRVRPGIPEDIPVLTRIEIEAAELFPPDALPPALAQPASVEELLAGIEASLLWVAEGAQFGVVGFIVAQAHGDSLHIAEMDVFPSHGRGGTGTKLLTHACDVAKDRSFRHVTLTTFEHLPWNAPFYSKHGFIRVECPDDFPHLLSALHQERARGLERRIAMVKNAA